MVRLQMIRTTWYAVSIAVVLLGGCKSTSDSGDYIGMSESDKARRVKILRDQADNQKIMWIQSQSNPDGGDLEAIAEFTRLHRETTQIYPSPVDCPLCYWNYGLGLRSQGVYYNVLYRKQEDRYKKSTDPRERQQLEEKIADNRDLAHRFFRQSIQQFESYLAGTAVPDLRVYDFLSQQCAELKDYRRGMSYLERFMNSQKFSESDTARLKKRLRLFKREYERQLVDDVEQDIGR